MNEVATKEDDQEAKREADLIWCRSQVEKLPVYIRNQSLCDDILDRVLPKYIESYGTTTLTWSKIRKKFAKELNETEPVISYIVNLVAKAGNGETFTIVDLCSGFGIASMLLSDLLDSTRVDKIWLLDKQWPCYNIQNPEKHHITTAHILQRKDWPIPVKIRRIDLKKKREKDQLPKYVYGEHNRILFFGIHLCKKLSVHAINLFSDCPNAAALVLKPCCLPGSKLHHLYTRDGNHKRAPIVYNFSNGYSFRPLDLYENMTKSLSKENENSNDVSVGEAESVIEGEGTACSNVDRESSSTSQTSLGDDKSITGNCDDDDDDDDSSTGHQNIGKGRTSNARFSKWLDHLECGCLSGNCIVRRETIEIQRHHFQNQFLFCERISSMSANKQ